MSPNKSPNIIKYSVITSSTAIVLIFISLIPVAKKAFYWNQCFKKTFQWIDKNEMELKNWDKASKENHGGSSWSRRRGIWCIIHYLISFVTLAYSSVHPLAPRSG